METIPLAMALFSGLARIDAGLLHAGPRSSFEAGTVPRRRRGGGRLIAPLAVAVVPLALGLTIGLAA